MLRLSPKHLGLELDVLRLDALLPQVLRHPPHQALCFELHERLRQRELRLLAQSFERLLFDDALDLALELEL